METITSVTKVLDLTNGSAYNATKQKYMLAIIKAKFNYLSTILKHRRFLFLNDVYSEFEIMPLTREGQTLGWIDGGNDLKIEWHAEEHSNAVKVTFTNLRNILNILPSEEEL